MSNARDIEEALEAVVLNSEGPSRVHEESGEDRGRPDRSESASDRPSEARGEHSGGDVTSGEPASFKDRLSQLLHSPIVVALAWLLVPALAAFAIGAQVEGFYRRPYFLGFGLVLAAAVTLIVNFNWAAIRSSALRLGHPRVWRPHWGWIAVGAAIALRYVLLQYMPPTGLAGFEEMQTGGISIRITQGWELPLSFLFTNLMGAAGFVLTDNTLDGLRSVFQLAGGLSILVMAMTLRRLSVGWTATLLAVFTMASLRVLVIGGGTADELFSGILFETLLLYCVASSIKSTDNAMTWAGLAGIFGGVLMYEYESYKPLVLLPPAYWFAAAVAARGQERGRALRAGSVYVLLFTVTALPAISSILQDPSGAPLADGLRRHWTEREFGGDYGWRAPEYLWAYTEMLLGRTHAHWSTYFQIEGDPLVPFIVGALFALGILHALWRPGEQIFRVAALTAVVMIVGASLLANNVNIGRMAPVLPILVLLTAAAVDATIRRFPRLPFQSLVLPRSATVYTALLIAVVVGMNAADTVRLSTNVGTLREYSNNSYLVCKAVGDEDGAYGRVYLYSNAHCNLDDAFWLYPHTQAAFENRGIDDPLPDANNLQPGDLVVLGHNMGELSEGRVAEFVGLSVRADSAHTLRVSESAVGRVVTLSFCYQCPPSDEP